MSFYTEGIVFSLHTNGSSVNTLQKKTMFFLPSCIHYSCCFTLYPSIFICHSETAVCLVSFLYLYSLE